MEVAEMSGSANDDLYIGIVNLGLRERNFAFSRGITLSSTYAHMMQPVVFAFAPAEKGKPHPAPWKSARGGRFFDITAQLHIPQSAMAKDENAYFIAWTVGFLLRLWTNPQIMMPVIVNMPFDEIASAPEGAVFLTALEQDRRHFPLHVPDDEKLIENLPWVINCFERTILLMKRSAEFRLAAFALDNGQFVNSPALTLVSLWGALEALFSPSTSELRFRVSSLIAAYLHPPSEDRLTKQKQIAALYDKRSAAAHGKPKHSTDDVLATFELLRGALIRMINDNEVPTKEQLEARLFGC